MKSQYSHKFPADKTDILLNHNPGANKEANASFWKKLFFGPHEINGEPIDEEENEAIMQQLAWWSRLE